MEPLRLELHERQPFILKYALSNMYKWHKFFLSSNLVTKNFTLKGG
jgi:hypothetical protein